MSEFIELFMPMELFWELFWYGIGGVAATIVSQFGYSIGFRKFHLSNVTSKTLSWMAAATTAFLFTRYLAFSGTQSGFWASAWLFFSTRIGTVLLTIGIMWLLIDRILKWDLKDTGRVKAEYGYWPEIINLIVTILETLLNYFVAKFWVF